MQVFKIQNDAHENKKMRLYCPHGEGWDELYPLEYFEEMLEADNHRVEMVLDIFEPKWGTGTFWCIELGEGFESGDAGCGLECSDYSPRNGKSGICKFWRPAHHPTGKTVTIVK